MIKVLQNTIPVLALAILLVASLYLISDATSNSASFGRYYAWLIFFNAAGLIILLTLIVYNGYRLVVQYRLKTIGSRLTTRMVGVFVVLTIIPVVIVYYFSLSFLHRSIDSWFDVGIEAALEDSLQLGRSALDLRKRDALNKTRDIVIEISTVDDSILVQYLEDTRLRYNASELTLMDHDQSILASSSIDSTQLPTTFPMINIGELSAENHYLSLAEDPLYGLVIRIAMLVQSSDATEKSRTLQALFPFTDRLNELTVGVQAAFDQYKELSLIRNPLKTSFTLALTLILLLSVLTAIWMAFVTARKLVSPIHDLVEGTKAVAAGNYEKQLAVSDDDELGILLRSFNTMTRKISRSRMIAEQSQQTQAAQKDYLESVMKHITSGVLTIDETGLIKRGNPAACAIFEVDDGYFNGVSISDVIAAYPMRQVFFELVKGRVEKHIRWQEEVIMFGQSGRKILHVRGTALQSQGRVYKEQVIVIDDLTQLIQAQKDSAWSEMARRLAHEIKNPLTPIQLSAEHLQHKLSGEVSGPGQKLLDRYTNTIVQQVEAMKSMVNAFTDYARSAVQKPQRLNFNQILEAIAVLYDQDDTEVTIKLDLEADLPSTLGDGVRLRQLAHNLIKNSFETIRGKGWIQLKTRLLLKQGRQFIEFSVEDSGTGIAADIVDNVFEPYVSTKGAGSGLGLAIVQKIVDEHSGAVWVDKVKQGGARFVVRLPLLPADMEDSVTLPDIKQPTVGVHRG